jgi:hypothetical protein
MNATMQIDAATATILSASIAAAISGFFTILNLWLTRRSDERRQARELAIKAALDHWKIHTDLISQKGGTIEPLELYLVHMTHFVRSMDGKITPEKIKQRLNESRLAVEAANSELREIAKLKEQRTQHGGMAGL